MECRLPGSLIYGEGVFPRTGNGLPGVAGDKIGEGEFEGTATEECGEAAGVADAPGWVAD
jgi:hypothetical protein